MNVLIYLCLLNCTNDTCLDRLNNIRKDIANIFMKDDPVFVLNKLLIEKYRTKQKTPRIADYTKDEFDLRNSSFQREWEMRFDAEVKIFLADEEKGFLNAKDDNILSGLKFEIDMLKERKFESVENLEREYDLADIILSHMRRYEQKVDDDLNCFELKVYILQKNLHYEKQLSKGRFHSCYI
ncbi:uncharacterized protein VNE69_04051 [Vairimorpha necatrix]|uniref:Uncharacterized protein n=1 Tax=Vairimorpha necatrix TaxID=6039 RepID=A0AAX4JB69_9MICR